MVDPLDINIDPGKITLIQPLGNMVLIRLKTEKERVSEGGIVMPNKSGAAYVTPIVAAVGPDVDLRKYNFKIGSKVIYNDYDAKRIIAKRNIFVITKPESIWAVFQSEE